MYWEFVILARKLGIVSIAVGLRGSASYQLAMMLLVLFGAFAAQVSALVTIIWSVSAKLLYTISDLFNLS
jgi:hypothetical protein